MNATMRVTAPFGALYLAEEDGAITHLLFSGERISAETATGSTELLRRAQKQLEEYFSGKRKDFDLPLNPAGTPFQKKVWQALREIPYAQTRSYKEIAEKIGCPKGMRAVGMANNRNPISIIVPCHRVIGANGKLVGYGGGLEVKDYLLRLERGIGR